MAAFTYDPANVVVIFGAAPLSGYADGTFISVEPNADDYSLIVGADGESVWSKTNNRSARVTVSILQSSASNDVLSAFRNLGLNTPGGDSVFPLLIKDVSGREIHSSEKARIVRAPTASFDREAGAREWIIEATDMISNFGGL